MKLTVNCLPRVLFLVTLRCRIQQLAKQYVEQKQKRIVDACGTRLYHEGDLRTILLCRGVIWVLWEVSGIFSMTFWVARGFSWDNS